MMNIQGGSPITPPEQIQARPPLKTKESTPEPLPESKEQAPGPGK